MIAEDPPPDVWAAIDQERLALVEDLALLDNSQWEAQSLCAEWKVRDVVGHLVFAANCDWKDFAVGLVKHRGNLDRVISGAATEIGAAPHADLEAQVADTVGSRNLPPFVKSACELADIVCHGEDIRRPLGLSRDVPVATLLVASEFLKDDRATRTPKRIKGLCLKATDAEWSIGDGPIVEGLLQSLVLAMAGRGNALEELSGEGLAELRTRIGAA
jgi:uncharacterized protein (TIGR03083 family)